MPYRPDTANEIYERIRSNLTGRISTLTNFVETSFNYIWSRAFTAEFRETEIAVLASQLSGWIDYSGGPVTEDDLASLGITDVDPDRVNKYMEDQDLDELAKIVGVDRDEGAKAEGKVTFTTDNSQTTIPKGTRVGTPPDQQGDSYIFETTEKAETADGVTEVSGVPIIAEEVGDEYNLTNISYLPSPPSGVQGVSQPEATSGGRDKESNDEMRKRVKKAILEKSGGGTADGVRGYVRNNTDGVESVSVDEFPKKQPPYVDVIVEGGTDADVRDSIDQSKPVGIEHNLVRPDFFDVNVSATLDAGTIDNSAIEQVVTDYLSDLGLSDDVIRDKIIQLIMSADSDINSITTLDVEIDAEKILYEGTSQGRSEIYTMSKGVEMEDDGIVEVTGKLNGSNTTFTEGTDYDEVDNDNDSSDDSIDWGIGGDSPDTTTGNTSTITYSNGTDVYRIDEKLIGDGITQVTGTLNGSSHTFTEGTDYEETDEDGDGSVDAIDWGIGGDSPDDGTSFEVTYTTGTYFYVTYRIKDDIPIETREKANPASITVSK